MSVPRIDPPSSQDLKHAAYTTVELALNDALSISMWLDPQPWQTVMHYAMMKAARAMGRGPIHPPPLRLG